MQFFFLEKNIAGKGKGNKKCSNSTDDGANRCRRDANRCRDRRCSRHRVIVIPVVIIVVIAATAHISAELAKSVTEREAADYQAAKAAAENKEQVRYEQVQKTIVRDVYHSHCIDADGLHIINQAVAGGN